MSLATDLLQNLSENPTEDSGTVLVVDNIHRTISIPKTITNLGVESDDDVRRLYFSVPRYYGEFDLSEFVAHINYKNAKGGGDVYLVDDLETTEDAITFSWLVDRFAFQYSGEVKFNVCLKKYSGDTVVKEFNTTPATLTVLQGLETGESAIKNSSPGVLDTVLMRLYAVEAASGLGQDGYYTVIRVNETDDGTVLTLINQDGEVKTILKHGEDGHTPVYKEDYFTDAEQAEFAGGILDTTRQYVDNWAPKAVTITLTAAKWSSNKQTVSVSGVAADSVVVVSPDPASANYSAYVDSEIRCISHSEGSLIFQCESTPSSNILVNVAIYYSVDGTTGGLVVTDDGQGNVTIM